MGHLGLLDQHVASAKNIMSHIHESKLVQESAALAHARAYMAGGMGGVGPGSPMPPAPRSGAEVRASFMKAAAAAGLSPKTRQALEVRAAQAFMTGYLPNMGNTLGHGAVGFNSFVEHSGSATLEKVSDPFVNTSTSEFMLPQLREKLEEHANIVLMSTRRTPSGRTASHRASPRRPSSTSGARSRSTRPPPPPCPT
jgi:hypothetical protein